MDSVKERQTGHTGARVAVALWAALGGGAGQAVGPGLREAGGRRGRLG